MQDCFAFGFVFYIRKEFSQCWVEFSCLKHVLIKGFGFLIPGMILFFPKVFASLHYKSFCMSLSCEKYDSNSFSLSWINFDCSVWKIKEGEEYFSTAWCDMMCQINNKERFGLVSIFFVDVHSNYFYQLGPTLFIPMLE